MEFGEGNMFCLGNRHQNGNTSTTTWDHSSWQTTSSSVHNNNAWTSVFNRDEANGVMYVPHQQIRGNVGVLRNHQAPYVGDGSHVHPDPHLMCLKLGKRHYFEDTSVVGGTSADKRGRGGVKEMTSTVPRCQVEGCHVALVNAKEYHRRHKVCEMHSKAPKVVVLGLDQRFCQQCSRFHVVSEFDDSKRSCRRRLAGHNERRRKSSHDSVARNSSQGGCALSLLSARSDSWLSPADLSIKCSAALRELIAENRAAVMARQFVSDRDWHLHHHAGEDFKDIQPESNYFPQHMFP